MTLKGKRVLVTGGAGFIPSHIVDMLVEKGAIVTVVDTLEASNLSNLNKSLSDVNFLKTDIKDISSLKKAMAGQEVVFHLAANADVRLSVKDPTYDYETNILGGFNVLRCAVDVNVEKLVYANSAASYGNPLYTPTDELHPTDPVSPYGASKLIIEKLGMAYHKTYGLPFCSIRIFNTYGERQSRFVMYDLLKKLYANPHEIEVIGTGDQIRDYSYVTDTARSFIMAAESEKSAGEVFNVSGGNPVSIKDVVALLLKTLNLRDTYVRYTGQSWQGDIAVMIADMKKIKTVIGFEPAVDLQTGVKKLHEWLIINEISSQGTVPI